jgi:Tol biopolymer transport system component
VTNRIAFVSARDKGRDIWTMDPDGGGLTQLTGSEGQEDDPAWSPDGTKIAFSSDRDGGKFFIYVMNADGSGVERLGTGTTTEHDPTWSPDGRFIAFAHAGDPSVISIVEVATHEEVGTLSQTGAGAAFPAWQIP